VFGWIVSGLLIGFGGKYGSACIGLHGFCGLPRLAWRSLVACGIMFGCAMLIATIRYNSPFFENTL